MLNADGHAFKALWRDIEDAADAVNGDGKALKSNGGAKGR